jgi:hypothetical protein
MRKNPDSQSGLFNPRTLIAVALCLLGTSFGWLSFASNPSLGTVSPSSPTLTYDAGPFIGANQSPLGAGQLDVGPRCDVEFPCDSFDLTVSVPAGYIAANPNAGVKVTLFWDNTSPTAQGASDYDLYIFNGAVTTLNGSRAADFQSAGDATSNPEVATIIPLVDGDSTWTIKIVPFQPAAETVHVQIQFLSGSGGGGFPGFGLPDPTIAGVPRYQTFAGGDTSSSGEFNIGFNPATGRIMTMNSGPIWRITPAEKLTPAKPECCAELWENVSNDTTNAGVDPILWTDQKTGRTFASNSTAGAGLVYGFSDDDGDLWVGAGVAPVSGGTDHETIVSGPFPNIAPYNLPGSVGDPANPVTHGQMVFYCSQTWPLGPATCQRSDTLGAEYGPGVTAYQGNGITQCSGIHGHVKVGPDGTVYLPVRECGSGSGLVISLDAGANWTEHIVPDSLPGGSDPTIAIGANNTIYYAYTKVNADATEVHTHVQVGVLTKTPTPSIAWSKDTDLGASHGVVNSVFPEAVAGDDNRVAVGFLGTDRAGFSEGLSFPGYWYLFIATTYNGGNTWNVVNATPNDPVQGKGGIWLGGGSNDNRNLLDFNEVTMTDKGYVLFGYSDGCVGGCVGNPDNNSFVAHMRVARQIGGKPLLSQFDPAEPALPKAPCLSGTRDCTAALLTWKAPDNRGSDITGYQILRGTTAGSETVLVANTGNTKTTYKDTTADPSVHYFYVVKAINGQGTGPVSSEVDLLSVGAIATDDVATTQENQPVIINVLANDCGLAPLSVISVTAPAHGTAINNGNGTVTYTPANGFFGPDTFTYTLQNGQAVTAIGTVRVTVKALCALINTGSFLADFETDDNGFTVQTPVNAPASAPWTRIADPFAQSGTMSFFTDDAATQGDAKDDQLISPPQLISSTSHLIFYHRFDLEPNYDGGVLEVSTDGGASYTDITNISAANEFISGAYNVSMTSGPIAGRMAWNGESEDFLSNTMVKVEVDLSALAGQTAIFRWRLRADDLTLDEAVGWWVDDVQFTNTMLAGPCPTVVSRKTHGGVADFDVALPLSGTPGIECRGPGSATNAYTLVYTLDRNPTAPGTATVSKGTATAGTPTLGPGANQVTVPLSGVTNAQHLVITLNRVQAAAGAVLDNLVGRMEVLVADTTGDGSVNSADISQTKSKSGQAVGSSNFRNDVTVDGSLNSADISLVKSKSGTALP